jgi:hypothetical protein
MPKSCAREAYPLGITDVTPLVNKLRAAKPQIIFPVSYLNDSLLIVRALRQQKVNLPIVGGSAGYVIPDFAKALGDFADGVLSICSANYDLDMAAAERYRKRWGAFMVHEVGARGVAGRWRSRSTLSAAEDTKPLRSMTFTEGGPEHQRHHQVRRAGPEHAGRAGDGAVAEERAGYGVAGEVRQGQAHQPKLTPPWRCCRPCWTGGCWAARGDLIGLTLVFGVVSIVNFAQAQFLMLGMYVAWFAWRYLGLDRCWAAAGLWWCFVVGWFMQQWLIRRAEGAEVAQIFLTVGILIVLENGALIVFA